MEHSFRVRRVESRPYPIPLRTWNFPSTWVDAHLTNRRGESKYYQEALIGDGRLYMILCPECETDLDVEEEEVDEGEVISCPECGTDFEVVTTSPLELKAVEEGYEEDDEEEESEENEDGDYS
jgi:alpha-aminoadipate/glutamate carrier protein LysW